MQPNDTTPHPKAAETLSKTGRRLRTFAALVALVLIIGFLVVHHIKSSDQDTLAEATNKNTSASQIVDVVTAETAPSSLPLTLPGETAAWYESVIYARVDGYVASWTANIGDHVQKGQVLATLETPDLDSQLTAARAKLKASEASVEFTQSTYERWKNSPKGVVSEQEREAKKDDYDRAVAQQGLDQADVDRYTTLASFKQVTAPYDGTITERHIDIGNLVTAGSTSNTTSLYRMVQDDPIRIFVDVPQSAAGDIKTDLPVQVTASNIPNRVFEGKVTRTADAINQQTRTLHVEVDMPNTDHALVSGMYVDVGFQIPTQGLVQVPAAALVFRSGGPQIAVVDKDNKVAFHKVTIASDSGNTVEIGSGIAAGDKIALNISSQITDGETVEAHESTDGANAQK
ncbi:MAG: efflux RND transporter periplasmic adaptor subunit [Alphaproteobacteria bacterium]